MTTFRELHHSILKDLKKLGIEVHSFELCLKEYSKSYYGRYDPNTKKVVVYIYRDVECTRLFPYKELFKTVVHEVCHHLQWSDPKFVRFSGVMHDVNFYRIFNSFWEKADILFKFREVYNPVENCISIFKNREYANTEAGN